MPGSGANAVGAPPQQQFSRPVDFTPSQAQQVHFFLLLNPRKIRVGDTSGTIQIPKCIYVN